MEKIVETKVCKHCSCQFNITDKDLEFYEKVSPIFNLETGIGKERPASDNELIKDLWNWQIKYLIPTPALCPECRQERRLSFRNERKLYKRKCDGTEKKILSLFNPDKPFKVFDHNYWWSDNWDSMSYWKDYSENTSFFKQFNKLNNDVPKLWIRVTNDMENCDYCNAWFGSKNCYMCCTPINSENCYYSHTSLSCLYDIDWLFNENSQYSYYSVHSNNNYNCSYLFYSNDCKKSHFLDDCINCENCFWCVNLRDKKYCYLNKQLSKEEYNNKIKHININDFKDVFVNFSKKQPKPYIRWINYGDSSWDFLTNCDNCIDCYWATEIRDSKYCWSVWLWSEDLYDCLHVWPAYKCYESITSTSSNNLFFTIDVKESSNSLYCYSCHNIKDCFWCVWLKNKSYCILNKQFTKEEYNELVPKIIEHMMNTWERREFFPSLLSPFWYNETVAEEYFPMTREEVLWEKVPVPFEGTSTKKWKIFNWSDYESPKPNVKKIIAANKLPENIADIPDDILNWAIECEVTKKPFRIIREELEFYRKHNLPIPRRHPDQRHLDRMKLRNPRKLYDRNCDNCWADIKTTYSPERPEIVYCEECYNGEVY